MGRLFDLTESPQRIEIELSNVCNLRCTYCPRHHLKGLADFMPVDTYDRIVQQIRPYPDTIVVLHRRGESLLHPEFTTMLDKIAGRFSEIQLATNATLLKPGKYEAIVNCITFLSFSLDTPNRYNQTRLPADYETVEENILQFLEYNNGRVKTQASMVKTKDTSDHECELFRETWQNRVDRVRIYDEHSNNGNFGSLAKPRPKRKPCIMPFYEILIFADGSVGRCNHDWIGTIGLNIHSNTINDIWNSDFFNNLRSQQSSLAITDPVCKKCDSWYPEIGNQNTGKVFVK